MKTADTLSDNLQLKAVEASTGRKRTDRLISWRLTMINRTRDGRFVLTGTPFGWRAPDPPLTSPLNGVAAMFRINDTSLESICSAHSAHKINTEKAVWVRISVDECEGRRSIHYEVKVK